MSKFSALSVIVATRSGAKCLLTRAGSVLAVATVALIVPIATSQALEKQSALQGLSACEKWCDEHNKTGESQRKCRLNCAKYWYCNGSDAGTAINKQMCTSYKSMTITTQPPQPPKHGSPATTNPSGTSTR